MRGSETKTPEILFGIDWARVEEYQTPDYIIEYAVVKRTPHTVTVRSTADGHERLVRWRGIFRATRRQCHEDVMKWLSKKIDEHDQQLFRLKRLLAQVEEASKSASG